MLGRLTHWLTAKLDGSDKEDDHLRQRFDALTRLKKTTMDLLQVDAERTLEHAASGAPGADSDSIKSKPRFTDDDAIVHDLGGALEQCLRLGLRNQSDVSLWNVLYSSSLVLDEPTLVHAIQLAATLADIIFSMACEQVVRMNYEEWSLMRCTEGLDIFLQLVIDIRDKLYDRARPTISMSYDAGLVASTICKSLLHLLKLIPAPEHPSINIVALSAEPFWELFDEEAYFFKLFHIMLQMFDQIWGSLPTDEASFTRVFCDTEAKLDELLKKSPSSVEDLRCEWEEMWRQLSEEDDGSTEEETSALTSGHPSPPRFCKKPSFAFKPEDYKTKLLNPSHILTLDHIAYIDHALPMTCQLCRWFLLYSTEVHGSSLHSLLVLAKNQTPTLIVVKDDQGNVFGGFGSDEWRRATQYFGNGETFIFSFAPRAGSTQTDGADPGANFVKYGWSRRNNYFMLCSEESLVMGGGGNFGLYLDSDLSHGTTGPCETFSSRPLVSSQEFNCVQVELWGFTTGDKRPVASRDRKKRSVLD
ncbi:hypothetical protein ATCC90586_003492 [Pythium insidiosum]|nr:hypothetical protein ATCC90586_003492 [Pythium insidiosum]